jgi:hypothetical protein
MTCEKRPHETAPLTMIVALVSEADRPSFWLQHFGNVPHWLRIESPIFSWLDLLCKDYHGDYWEFYTLSNGGHLLSRPPKASTHSLTH